MKINLWDGRKSLDKFAPGANIPDNFLFLLLF